MNDPICRAGMFYRERGDAGFHDDLMAHLRYGRVHSTPESLMLVRGVRMSWPDSWISDPNVVLPEHDCDAWFIWLASGNMVEMSKLWATCGTHIERIGYARKGRIRFFPAMQIIETLAKCSGTTLDSILPPGMATTVSGM